MRADLLRLERDLGDLKRAGITTLHVDVMDGHYVQNFMFGRALIEQLVSATSFLIDVHLMALEPLKVLDCVLDPKPHSIQFHPEVADDPGAVIDRVREAGVSVGIALHPDLALDGVQRWFGDVDQVTVMSAAPGFSGGRFDERTFGRVQDVVLLRRAIGASFRISVDGSVRWEHMPCLIAAGVDRIVVGSVLFGSGGQLASTVEEIRRHCEAAVNVRDVP